ncbi:type II toxin-antitoxin system death-on-curing family toxin [Streptomyces sp. MI02-7b]|uniref:type II toxin-antitoxin system death-on-curing family toxin n=1 Tax=Streptomyces sp. MI02-7b TaxID=462941 RepID=UPI0029AB3406|nr:Fic family protein [Streptomyces sp. MI02-7b]MDX3077301.1 Fic family protein [Streptomyces sp. MI02-7b]
MRHLTVDEVTELARLACGGEPPAVREPGLLASAVHRPRARMFGVAAYGDLYACAGALLHGIAANHPLVDGNKRTAWLAAAVLLDLNGVDLRSADQGAAYELVIEVASGAVGDPGSIGQRLRALATR